jgi:hypothetical protein
MVASMLLEALQALTPTRHADLLAGLYGAGGALAAALLAKLFTRAWRWRTPLRKVKIAGELAVVAFAILGCGFGFGYGHKDVRVSWVLQARDLVSFELLLLGNNMR